MGDRFQKICRENGCVIRTNSRSGYCPAHEKDNARSRQRAEYDAERHKGPIAKLYNATWDKLKILLRQRGNVICQRLTDGKQCTRFVEIFHHLVSPRKAPTLMYAPRNIVGLCRQHHPPDDGTPWWIEGVDYAPTNWSAPIVGEEK